MIPADERKFLDAGIFIGAILLGDPRHSEAYPLVEAARHGDFRSCTSVGVLREVYAALTWTGTVTPHTPANNVTHVYTYDPADRHDFLADGIVIAGPPSTLASHAPTKRSQNI